MWIRVINMYLDMNLDVLIRKTKTLCRNVGAVASERRVGS